MSKNNSMFDDIDKEPSFLTKCWWKISNFIDNWIYPAHFLKNFLFHNYNKIKLPMFKPYEYLDVSVRMEFAVFELIKEFIEKEQPEKYICWYKDEKGEDVGHKYGDYEGSNILFQSLKGKYIMDIIKDIYNFYTKVLPEMEKEKDYLLSVWSKYIFNGHYVSDKDNKDLVEWVTDKTNYTLKDLEKENLNWNIILKYIEKKENFFDDRLLHSKIHEQEKLINNQIQYYLHLAIEVREYLWT